MNHSFKSLIGGFFGMVLFCLAYALTVAISCKNAILVDFFAWMASPIYMVIFLFVGAMIAGMMAYVIYSFFVVFPKIASTKNAFIAVSVLVIFNGFVIIKFSSIIWRLM
jgi:hypothetical protein